jgi:hypothetical protein
MRSRIRAAFCALLCLLLGAAATAQTDAARPIADAHSLDAYFALFAPDSNVPWKPATVRLETYTSAPVDLTVYAVDPSDVLTAGSNARPRAVNTARLHPLAHWQFTPPGGFQFQSSEIAVPLGTKEGFFVVEARRGTVAEQVWINRTRVGLIAKQSPGGVLLYGADLGTGRPLASMRVELLVGNSFATRMTDAHGIVRWNSTPHPAFALAQWGASYAFVSLPPQAPIPQSIVGVRTDTAVTHAGDIVRVVGFARTHGGNGSFRASTGNVQISVRAGTTQIAHKTAALDKAGAFSTSFDVPRNAPAGEYAVLAQADGGIGSSTLHVDGDAGGLTLSIAAACAGTCDASSDVPIVVQARRNDRPAKGVTIHVSVVRSPHFFTSQSSDVAPWGIAQWYDATMQTGGDGRAAMAIPRPSDGLASTYGVRADAGDATADTRIVVPTSRAALDLSLDRTQITPDGTLGFSVLAVDAANDKPLRGATVTVTLQSGAAETQPQTLVLDANGRASGTLAALPLGTSTVIARTTLDGSAAADAAEVHVDPQLPAVAVGGAAPNVRIGLDHSVYRAGDVMTIRGSDGGAQGDVLLSFDDAAGFAATVTPQRNGTADATFRTTDAAGTISASAAFVRDGTLEWNAIPVSVDAPGRGIDASIVLDAVDYAPDAKVHIQFDESGVGTVAIRISRGAPSGGALFESLSGVLGLDLTTTQTTAPSGVTWHPWVDSSGSHAQIYGSERRGAPPADPTLAQADSQAVYWAVVRGEESALTVPAPSSPGRYTLSLLKIYDDGRIAASSSNLVVR